jgi:preprotein translocase subunit SecD
MRKELTWKACFHFGLILVAALLLFLPQIKETLFKGEDPIRQGLDLQGGIELVLAPDYRVEDRVLLGIKEDLNARITKLGIAQPKSDVLGIAENNKYDGLKFTFASADEVKRVLNAKAVPERMDWNKGVESMKLLLKSEQDSKNANVLRVNIQIDPAMFDSEAIARAKEIISRRVNSSGLAETDVRYDQKNKRIQVQLPGVDSIEKAEKLLKATGRLNFRLNGKIVMFGDDLKDAKASLDPSKGVPVINFRFGDAGAQQFYNITRANVGQQLAMYLDEKMLMEPVINEPIPNGSGQITLGGGTSMDQAREYAILMRSGALPISLRTIQNTQVAPTLGSEMIRQSIIGGVVGLILVILFMITLYGVPGMVANIALAGYAILTLGAMAVFRGVLTLPGVAGFILSVGMAVDANMIIFERIKDELRNGKRLRAAVDGGFHRAFSAIFDSNLTTMITAIVLLFFGTGPIKGFGVTLTLGILISMFTAILVTRNMLDMMVDKNPDKYAKLFRP